MIGTGKGAENGILFKSAEALETAHAVNCVVLDKTGTVTEGKPAVTDLFSKNIPEKELLLIAASLEKASEHPFAEAILKKAESENISLKAVAAFQAFPGKGISGIIDGEKYFAGNALFMTENNFDLFGIREHAEKQTAAGATPLYFADKDGVIGIIAAADTVRPDTRDAIDAFRKMNIEVVMLTGDNRKTAESIGAKLGITRILSEVLPQDKDQEIIHLQEQGRKVAMVGDGINDAPALVRSDLGIAIGAGTDIAIESADVVLAKSSLLDAVAALRLGKAVIRNIKMNLFWAFFYNCLGIPLAAGLFYPLFGWKLSPMFAAAAMSLSSVSVVLNALRLRLFKMNSTISNQQQDTKKI